MATIPFFYDPHVIENLDPTIEGLQLGEFRLVTADDAIYQNTRCNDLLFKTKYNSQQIHFGLGDTTEASVTLDKNVWHCKTPYGLKVELDDDHRHHIDVRANKKKKTIAFSDDDALRTAHIDYLSASDTLALTNESGDILLSTSSNPALMLRKDDARIGLNTRSPEADIHSVARHHGRFLFESKQPPHLSCEYRVLDANARFLLDADKFALHVSEEPIFHATCNEFNLIPRTTFCNDVRVAHGDLHVPQSMFASTAMFQNTHASNATIENHVATTARVMSNLLVPGNIEASNVRVLDHASIPPDASITVDGKLLVNGTIDIQGDFTSSGSPTFSRTATFLEDVIVSQNVDVSENLSACNATIDRSLTTSNAHVLDTLSICNDVEMRDKARFGQGLVEFYARAQFQNTAQFERDVTLHENGIFHGDILSHGDITQDPGYLTTLADLVVQGESTMYDMRVKGKCVFDNAFEMLTLPIFKNGIRVENNEADMDKLHVRNDSVFRAEATFHGDVEAKKNVHIQGDLITEGSLTMKDASTFQNNVDIEKNAHIHQNLDVEARISTSNLQSTGEIESKDGGVTSRRGGFHATNASWRDILCVLERSAETSSPQEFILQSYSPDFSPLMSASLAQVTALGHSLDGYVYLGFANGCVTKINPHNMIRVRTREFPSMGEIAALVLDIHTHTLIVASDKVIALDADSLEMRATNMLDIQAPVTDMGIFQDRLYLINAEDTLFSIEFFRYDKTLETYQDIRILQQFTFGNETLHTMTVGRDGFLYLGYEIDGRFFAGRFSRDFVSQNIISVDHYIHRVLYANIGFVYVCMSNGIIQQLRDDFSPGAKYNTTTRDDDLFDITFAHDFKLYALGGSLHRIDPYTMTPEKSPFSLDRTAQRMLFTSASDQVESASSSWNTSFTWTDDPTTGVFHPQNGRISFAVSNAPAMSLGTHDISVYNDIHALRHLDIQRELRVRESSQFSSNVYVYEGTEKEPGISCVEDHTSGFYFPKTNAIGLVTGARERLRIDDNGFVGIHHTDPRYALDVAGKTRIGDQLYVHPGTAASPSIAFDADPSTGIYHPSTRQLAIAVDGHERLRIDNRGFLGIYTDIPRYHLHVNGIVRAEDQMLASKGSAFRPAFSFEEDPNTGMFYENADELSFSTNGFYRGAFRNDGFHVEGDVHTRSRFLAENQGDQGYPVFSFANDERTGIFLREPHALCFSTNGYARTIVDVDGLEVNGNLRLNAQSFAENGDQSLPAYSFMQDKDTGMFLQDDDTLAFSTRGMRRGVFDTEGCKVDGSLRVTTHVLTENGRDDFPVYSFQRDATSGMYLRDTGFLAFSTSNAYRGGFDELGLHVDGALRMRDQILPEHGSSARPAYSFQGDRGTGMFLPQPNMLSFSTHEKRRGTFHDDGLDVTGSLRVRDQMLASLGEASLPTYTFENNPNTGMFVPQQDHLAFAAGGAHKGSFHADGLSVDGDIVSSRRFSAAQRGSPAAPVFTFDIDDASTGIYSSQEDTISFSTDGDHRGSFDAEGIYIAGSARVRDRYVAEEDGRTAYPVYTFATEKNTGVYLDSHDDVRRLAFSTQGAYRGSFDDRGLDVEENVRARAQYLAESGRSASSPTYSFTQDPDTGMYQSTPDTVAFSTNGTYRGAFHDTGLDVAGTMHASGPLRAEMGSAAEPIYSFTQDAQTGTYLASQNVLAFSSGGEEKAAVDARGFIVHGDTRSEGPFLAREFGSASRPVYTFDQDPNTGMYRKDTDVLAFGTGGEYRGAFDTQGMVIHGRVRAREPFWAENTGTETAPMYSFQDQATTGLYLADDALSFTVMGSRKGAFGGDGLDVYGNVKASQQFLAQDEDTPFAPKYSFQTNDRTGMYLQSNNTLGFSTNGLYRVSIHDDALRINGDLYANGQHLGEDDSFSRPAFSFSSDRSTGMLMPSPESLAFSVHGNQRLALDQEGISVNGSVRARQSFLSERGQASSPTYAFTNSLNTGMYLENNNTIGLSTNGLNRVLINGDGIEVMESVKTHDRFRAPSGTRVSPTHTFSENPTTGMYLDASADRLAFSTDEILRGYFDADGFTVQGNVHATDPILSTPGSRERPVYSFASDRDTGMYLKNEDTLALCTDGQDVLSVRPEEVHVHGNIRADMPQWTAPGSRDAPAYSFASETATGMFLRDSRVLAFTVDSNVQGYLDEAGMHAETDLWVNHQLFAASGRENLPAYSFSAQKDTGMYFTPENQHLCIATRGTKSLDISEEETAVRGDLYVRNQYKADRGSAEAPRYSFTQDSHTGMFLSPSHELAFATQNELRGSFHRGGLRVRGDIHAADGGAFVAERGSALAPTHTFVDNETTGLYLQSDAISLGVAINEEERARFHQAGLDVLGTCAVDTQYLGPHGDSNRPLYSFTSQTNTGMYLDTSDGISFAQRGNRKALIHDHGFRVFGDMHPSAHFVAREGQEDDPGYTFDANRESGMYLRDGNAVGFVTSNTYRGSFYDQGLDVQGKIRAHEKFAAVARGTPQEPVYTFEDDIHTGLYLKTTDILGLVSASKNVAEIRPAGLYVQGDVDVYGQYLAQIGSADAPAYAFSVDQDTGIYLKDLNTLALATEGRHRVSVTNEGVEILGRLAVGDTVSLPNGKASAPTYTFDTNPGTGMYLKELNVLGFSTEGVHRGLFDTYGFEVEGNIRARHQFLADFGNEQVPAYSFLNDRNTGIFLEGENILGFSTNKTTRGVFDDAGLSVRGETRVRDQLRVRNGDARSPHFSFEQDDMSGLYLASATTGTLGLSCQGREVILVDTDEVQVFGDLRVSRKIMGDIGEVARPTYAFGVDRDTGMFLKDADTLGFAVGGSNEVYIDENGLHVEHSADFGDRVRSGNNGSAARPVFTFRQDSDTGMFLEAQNVLAFSADGRDAAQLTPEEWHVWGNVRVEDRFIGPSNDATRPTYSFTYDQNTGTYLKDNNQLAFSVDGSYKGSFDEAGLEVDGQVRAQKQVRVHEGSVGVPHYAFAEDALTGTYLASPNTLAFATRGSERARMTTDGMDVTGNVQTTQHFSAGIGEASLPAYTFTYDTSTGMYLKDIHEIAFSTAGEPRGYFNEQGLYVQGTLQLEDQILAGNGQRVAPSYSFNNDTQSGLYLVRQGVLGLGVHDNLITRIDDGGVDISGALSVSGQIVAYQGTPVAPSLTFAAERDTGIYRKNPGNMGISVSGNDSCQITSEGLTVYGNLEMRSNIFVGDGAESNPSIAFRSDDSTGLYLDRFNALGITVNDKKQAEFDRYGVWLHNYLYTDRPIIAASGTGTAPSYTFRDHEDIGIYLTTDDTLAVSIDKKTVSETYRDGINVNGDIRARNRIVMDVGVFNSPSITFNDHETYGIYFQNETISFSMDATTVLDVSSNGIFVNGPVQTNASVQNNQGEADLPSYTFTSDLNTGLFLKSAGVLGISAAQKEIAVLDDRNVSVDGDVKAHAIRTNNGSVTNPSYTFEDDQDTGMYKSSDDTLAFATAGTQRGYFDGDGFHVSASNNSIHTPRLYIKDNGDGFMYTFQDKPNTGMFLTSGNDVGIAVNGVQVAEYNEDGITVTGNVSSSSNISTGMDFITQSDRRTKKDIQDIRDSLATIHAMRGVHFTRVRDKSRHNIGFIAQELLPVLPQVVTHDDTTKMYGVNYGAVTALLVEGIKELDDKWHDALERIHTRLDRLEENMYK